MRASQRGSLALSSSICHLQQEQTDSTTIAALALADLDPTDGPDIDVGTAHGAPLDLSLWVLEQEL
jgi:hypothetical protein